MRFGEVRRHLAIGTKQSKAEMKKKKRGEDVKDETYKWCVKLLDSPRKVRPKFSPDVAAKHFAIGREYNSKWRKKHDLFCAKAQLKLDIQQFALTCLPPDLKEHAVQLDDCPPPPLDRRFWTWTPPIPGFKPEEHAEGN